MLPFPVLLGSNGDDGLRGRPATRGAIPPCDKMAEWPEAIVVAPGEVSLIGRLRRAGVHGRDCSISISVSKVLRERSGAIIVLGMSAGTSGVRSGVGRVIGMSGTGVSEMLSQLLES